MLSLGTFLFVFFYINTHLNGAQGLKNVKLHLDPSIVQKGESSTIECAYDLEGAQLYTVKWYRGHHEFYRYTPSEHPSTKIFPYTGLHVNLESSNEHQVVLRKVGFNLSGNFSCEVTTEAPFSTAVVSENMLVVVLPSINAVPTLSADKTYYILGDTLKANCTSQPSRPAATLTFYMNNQVVCEKCQTRKRAVDELFVSDLSLELPLFSSHFAAGQLILRCVAQIGDLYNQNSETRLDNTKDPVPEKVTSPNYAATLSTITIENLLIGLFLYFILIFR